ncbi:unannotated protein [freshwater metagenome]|uniref:Unannotated protein n=1 Tax=freshwater metagenome TaxID=449393 RepID=A0A6J7P2K0_9ZZZZ
MLPSPLVSGWLHSRLTFPTITSDGDRSFHSSLHWRLLVRSDPHCFHRSPDVGIYRAAISIALFLSLATELPMARIGFFGSEMHQHFRSKAGISMLPQSTTSDRTEHLRLHQRSQERRLLLNNGLARIRGQQAILRVLCKRHRMEELLALALCCLQWLFATWSLPLRLHPIRMRVHVRLFLPTYFQCSTRNLTLHQSR